MFLGRRLDLLIVLFLLCLLMIIDELVLVSHQTCLNLAVLRKEERLVVRWGTERGGGRLWYLILWLFLLLKRRLSTLALCLHGVILVSYSQTCRLLILLRSKVLSRLMLICSCWILLEKASWGAILKLDTPASLISGTNQALFANRALYRSDFSFSINLLGIIILPGSVGVVNGWVCCTDIREARLIRVLRLNCLDHLLTWCWFLILGLLNWVWIGCQSCVNIIVLLLEGRWCTTGNFLRLIVI